MSVRLETTVMFVEGAEGRHDDEDPAVLQMI